MGSLLLSKLPQMPFLSVNPENTHLEDTKNTNEYVFLRKLYNMLDKCCDWYTAFTAVMNRCDLTPHNKSQ